MSDTDLELLARYTRHHAEDAFAELVRRHLALVHSAALRQVRSPQLAEEVAQSTFLKLARQARQLAPDTILTAWLYQVARRESIDVVRREARRQLREQIATEMNAMNATAADWTHIEPLLDEAMHALDDTDRAAVLLRYFENKSLREVGAALGTSDDTAQKRVSRAVERLREFFAQRGVTVGASGLVVVISANAVQAAPVGLSAAIAAAALAGTTMAASTTAAATKGFALTTWQTTSIVAALVLAITAPLYLQHRARESRRAQSGGQSQPGVSHSAASANSPGTTTSIVSPGAVSPGETRPVELAVEQPREPFSTNAQFTLGTPPGALAIQPDGKILAATTLGGWFVDEASGTLGWYARGAMRFEANGTLDRSFFVDVGRPGGVNPMASHLSLAPDGRIFLSGSFGSVDGKSRPGHALLFPDGRIVESFEPWRGKTNVNTQTWFPGGPATGIMLNDGSVAVMSGVLDGSRAPYFLTAYRMDASGRIIQSTNALSEFGRLGGLIRMLDWGGFWANTPIDWTPGTPSASQAAAMLHDLFEEVPIELCRYAVRLQNGGVIMAIREGGIRGHFMRFDKDWRSDTGFTNQFDSETTSCMNIQRLKDGKLLVAGLVGRMNGEAFSGLVRLEQNGATDHSFRCETSGDVFGRVLDFAIQEDGRIVICGYFAQVNGVPCQYLARLNSDGSLDPTFKPPFLAQAELDRRRFLRVARLTKKPADGMAAASAGTNTASSATNATPSDTIMITSIKLEPSFAVISFNGQPGQLYILQAREAMHASEWVKINTNRASPSGTGVLRDEQGKQTSMRFYRVAIP